MTQETLNKANNLTNGIKWAEDVLYHIAVMHRVSLRFDWSKSCIDNNTRKSCPDWLKDIIRDAVEAKKAEMEQELESL